MQPRNAALSYWGTSLDVNYLISPLLVIIFDIFIMIFWYISNSFIYVIISRSIEVLIPEFNLSSHSGQGDKGWIRSWLSIYRPLLLGYVYGYRFIFKYLFN
jgi:hypothetical protein